MRDSNILQYKTDCLGNGKDTSYNYYNKSLVKKYFTRCIICFVFVLSGGIQNVLDGQITVCSLSAEGN